MWWAASKRKFAYLGERSVGIADSAGAWRWFDAPGTTAGVVCLFDELVKGAVRRGSQLDLWLSGALARPFIFEPVAGLKDTREAQMVAERSAIDSLGLAGPCTVWLDTSCKDRPCIAVAVQREVLDVVLEGCRRTGIRLNAIRPWWAKVLNDSLQSAPQPEFLLIDEPDSWTLLAGADQTFRLAEIVLQTPTSDEHEGREWLRRMQFNAGTNAERGTHACLVRQDRGLEGVEPAPFASYARLSV